MGVKTITVSFKNTDEDMRLYSWILTHSNLSGFIKDTLRSTMNRNDIIESKSINKNNNDNLIDLNF